MNAATIASRADGRDSRRPPALPSERGTVTAELAVGLPGLLIVVAMALWAVAAMATKVACVDAARAGVRVAARGEPMPAVRAAVWRVAPAGSQVVVRRAAATTTVEVAVGLSMPLRRELPLGTIRATATGATEPGAVDADDGSTHAGTR